MVSRGDMILVMEIIIDKLPQFYPDRVERVCEHACIQCYIAHLIDVESYWETKKTMDALRSMSQVVMLRGNNYFQ